MWKPYQTCLLLHTFRWLTNKADFKTTNSQQPNGYATSRQVVIGTWLLRLATASRHVEQFSQIQSIVTVNFEVIIRHKLISQHVLIRFIHFSKPTNRKTEIYSRKQPSLKYSSISKNLNNYLPWHPVKCHQVHRRFKSVPDAIGSRHLLLIANIFIKRLGQGHWWIHRRVADPRRLEARRRVNRHRPTRHNDRP